MNNRDVSISTGFNKSISLFEQLPIIKAAGFTHLSLSSDLLKYSDFVEGSKGIFSIEQRSQLKSQLDTHQLKVDTLHGGSFDEGDGVAYLKALIEVAKDLESNLLIMHPYRGFETFPTKLEEKISKLLDVTSAVQPLLEASQIKIAIENLHPEHTTTIFKRVFSEVNTDYIGWAYDTSHDQIDGPHASDLLEQFSQHVLTAGISDRSAPYIDHLLPGEGFVFFADVCRKLRTSGYNRPLVMSVKMDHSMYKDPEAFLSKAYQSGRMLMNQISPLKKL